MNAARRSAPVTGSILLFEEDPENSRTLTTLLSNEGYDVIPAGTGATPLGVARASPPDLILLGTDLAGTDGSDICRQLRADAETADIPILFVGNRMQPHHIAEMIDAGADAVLPAPFQAAEILSCVQMHMDLVATRKLLAQKDAQVKQAIEARWQLDRALVAARESGERLIDNLSEVIYSTDEQGILTYLSPAIERLLDYLPSEVIGRHISEFIYPEDLPELAERFPQVLDGQNAASEYRVVAKSGEIRWVHTSSQPMFEGNRVTGAHGILTDVTERKRAEEQIRKQNRFLVSILESLTHPFYVLDVHDYTIRIANSAALDSSVAGQSTCYALAHRSDAPCSTADHPCPIEEIKRTRSPVTVEHIHFDQHGQPRNVEVHGYPLFDDNGDIVQVIEYSFDITERKQAQEALRRSEKRYRQLLETLQEGIWALDRDANTSFVNPRMAEMLGYTVEEMQGKHLFSFMDDEGVEIAQRNLERRNAGIREQHDFEFLRRDGSRMYALLETSPILDDDGNYVGAIAGIQDITYRRQAEQALKKSEALLRETQQIARLGGWELDLGTSRVTWTDEVYRIHEVAPDFQPDLDNALEFYHTDDRPRLEQAIREATERGKPWDLELQFTTATGERLWVRAIGRAEHQDGKVVRLSGTFQDITELKQAEHALEEAAKVAERNRLARDLHDSVTQALFSASLVAEVLPQAWQRDAAAAMEGLEELRLLTRGALAEMRTMLLELRPTALVETRLHELLWQLTEATTSRAQLLVTFDIEPVPKLPAEVHVTFYRVAQEALNNAAKHAEAGQVSVSLHASPPISSQQPDGWQGQVTLQIADDGRGFAPGDSRPDQLGLNIMRERANGIGASLTIESYSEHGTRVTLVWTGRSSL
jgi:PAS domain S-box-containing protein